MDCHNRHDKDTEKFTYLQISPSKYVVKHIKSGVLRTFS